MAVPTPLPRRASTALTTATRLPGDEGRPPATGGPTPVPEGRGVVGDAPMRVGLLQMGRRAPPPARLWADSGAAPLGGAATSAARRQADMAVKSRKDGTAATSRTDGAAATAVATAAEAVVMPAASPPGPARTAATAPPHRPVDAGGGTMRVGLLRLGRRAPPSARLSAGGGGTQLSGAATGATAATTRQDGTTGTSRSSGTMATAVEAGAVIAVAAVATATAAPPRAAHTAAVTLPYGPVDADGGGSGGGGAPSLSDNDGRPRRWPRPAVATTSRVADHPSPAHDDALIATPPPSCVLPPHSHRRGKGGRGAAGVGRTPHGAAPPRPRRLRWGD